MATNQRIIEIIKPIIEKTFLVFVLFTVFFMPFNYRITNIAIIIHLFLGLFLFNWSTFITNFKENRVNLILFSSILLFFLLYVFGYFYSENKSKAIDELIRKIYFVLFVIIYLSFKEKFVKNYLKILNLFVLANLIAGVICLIIAFYNSLNIINNELIFDSLLKENWQTNFLYQKFSYFLHVNYASLYFNLALGILFFYPQKQDIENQNYLSKFLSNKKIRIILSIFFIGIILLASSRSNFIALFLLAIVLFFKVRLKYKYLYLVLFLSISILYILNSRFKYPFKTIISSIFLTEQTENNTFEKSNVRFEIWKSALNSSKENIWFGIGLSGKKIKLENNENYKNRYFDTHNYYLETLISFGLLGLSLFLTILGASLLNAIKKQNYLYLSFLIIVMVNLFFENILNRLAGIIFFIFFIVFFTLINDELRLTPQCYSGKKLQDS